MRGRTDLQGCAVLCCHCGIRFFTHPRNAGRQNLRCEFGCRQHHRRQRANERSRKHYRTADGGKNKKRLNGRRSKFANNAENASPRDVDTPPSSVDQPAFEEAPDAHSVNCSGVEAVGELAATHTIREAPSDSAAASHDAVLPLEELLLDEPTLVNSGILPYVLMVASVIERRTISRDELIAVLRKSVRQRSFDRWPRREYVLHYLHEHPP